jgi:DNA ligase-1
MRRFAETADAISKTTSKLRKIAALADYLSSLTNDNLRAAAVFFTGRPFPLSDARTLNVGWAALMRAVQELSGASELDIHNTYLEFGDLGEVAERLLAPLHDPEWTPAQVAAVFDELARTSGATARQDIVIRLLHRLSPAEVKYVIKIITGELRIGLKENTVEEAIAKAFGQRADFVRRTNMSLGDIGETAILARQNRLSEASLRIFRPVKFMLATPIEQEEDVFKNFPGPFYVEDKYDGIRGQLHVDTSTEAPGAALYSRTLDDVSIQFPEIVEQARSLGRSLIADGEVVAFRDGQVLPFALLQRRLGRKRPSGALRSEIPVTLMVFDVLHLDGRTVIDEPLVQRKALLKEIPWTGCVSPAPFELVDGRRPLAPMFDAAAARRNEGLMLKDAESSYAPGKRGMSWLKWKRALATLDVVVTGVEYGHGRRRDVLSDYTFAVQGTGRLLNVGKAYSGLTDREILEMTEYFKQHTIQDFGRFRLVEPVVVIEVAFNGIQASARHESGFALRFPRIVRIRTDKRVDEIDTVETVRRLHATHTGV